MKNNKTMFEKVTKFAEENKVQFITKMFIIALAILAFVDMLPLSFSYEVLKINNYFLACVLILGGLFSCFKRTSQTGWFILGGITIIFIVDIIVHLRLSPDLHFINWLILLPFIIWLYLCIYSSLASANEINSKIVDLINQNEKRLKIIDDSRGKINDLNTENRSYALDKERLERENKFKTDEITKQNTTIKQLDKQLYESQLSVLFSIVMANSYHGKKDFGLHSFQGNIDNVFADFIGQTNCTFWLLELKRGEKEIYDEKLKDIRQQQFNALKENDNEKYKIIADRCHWLGWGDNQNVADILFASYWGAVFELNILYKFDLDEFVYNSFSDENPIGVNEIEFKKYLDFLLLISKKDTIDIDNIPIVIFRKDSAGRLSKIKSTLFNFIHEYDLYMQREVASKIERNMDRGMSMSR